jgi:uncharacterized membrane protein
MRPRNPFSPPGRFSAGPARSHVWFRWFNEAAVLLVVLKPF